MRRLIPFSLIVLCLFAAIGNVAAKDDKATHDSIPHAIQGDLSGIEATIYQGVDLAETTAPGEDVAAPDNAASSGSDAVAAPDTSDATESVSDTGDSEPSPDATEVVDTSDQAEATAAPSALTSVSRLSATVPVPLQHALDNVKDQAQAMQDYMRAAQAIQNAPKSFDLAVATRANPDLAQQAIQETLDWANKFTDPVQRQDGFGRIIKVTTLMVDKLIARYGSLANSMKHSKLAVTHVDRRQQSDNGILIEATEPNSQATIVLTDDLRLGITSGSGEVLFAGVIFFNRFGEPALITKESDGSEYRYSEDGYSLHQVGSQFDFSDGKTEYDMQDVAGKLTYTDPNGQTFTLNEKVDGLDITLPSGSDAKFSLNDAYTITAPDGMVSAQGTLDNPSDTDALNADEAVLNPSTDETSVSTPSDKSSNATVTQPDDDNGGDTPVAPDSGSDQSGQDQGADSGG